MTTRIFRILALLATYTAVNVLTTGCTSLQGYPYFARIDDTVAFAVGSPDNMTTANTSAVFVSKGDPGYPLTPTEYPVTVRSVFKLYADKASPIYQRAATAKQVIDNSGHEPWVTIAAVEMDNPSIPVGAGEVRFTTTATYPTIGTNINNLPIDIEILPGAGASSTFPYEIGTGVSALGDLSELEAKQHAVVYSATSTTGAWPQYGAIEINMDISASAALLDRSLRVWLDDMTIASSSGASMIWHVANGKDLKVIILSHQGTLKFYEARFAIVLPGEASFTTTPTITSVNYYDINGNAAAGPAIVDYTVEERS